MSEGSIVCSLTSYSCYYRTPLIKRVRVLSICFLRRNCTVVNRCCTVSKLAALEYFVTVLEGNHVLVESSSECCFVRSSLGYFLESRCPTYERVRVLIVSEFAHVCVSRHCTVLYLGRLNQTAVLVEPCDHVLVLHTGVSCSVGCISNDCYRCYIPTTEGIRVLGRVSLRSVCMSRNNTVCNLGYVDDAAIVVLPSNLVAVQSLSEGCIVCSLTSYRSDSNIPTAEGIGVLCCSFLDRCCTAVSRYLAILPSTLLQLGITALEDYQIAANLSIEYCIVNSILCYGSDWFIPACERVVVLGRSSFFRCTRISRCLAISKRLAIEYIFAVHEGDSVIIQRCAIGSRVSSVTGYSSDIVIPASERICILSISFLGRSSNRVSRCCTISQFAALQLSAVLVREDNHILVHNLTEGCLINGFTSHRFDGVIPTIECVGVLCRSFLDRCRAAVSRCYAISPSTGLQDSRTVLEGYCIAASLGSEDCVVGSFRGYGYKFLIPTCEGVGVLSIGSFSRISSCVVR